MGKRLQPWLLSDALTGEWQNGEPGEGQGSEPCEPRGLRHQAGGVGFTRIGEEERRDGEAIALHTTHIWANSLKPVCFLCFLLFWCPLLPFIETGTLKI